MIDRLIVITAFVIINIIAYIIISFVLGDFNPYRWVIFTKWYLRIIFMMFEFCVLWWSINDAPDLLK